MTPEFHRSLQEALATAFSLNELNLLARTVRPNVADPLPMDTDDIEDLVDVLVKTCILENLLPSLIATAYALKPRNHILQELALQLNQQLAMTPFAFSDLSMSTQYNMNTVEPQRDAFIASTINQQQLGGVRFGDGAQFPLSGMVAGHDIFNINLGLPQQAANNSFTNDFDRRYLRDLLYRYAVLRPLQGGDTGPGRGASGKVQVPRTVELAEAFVPLSLSPSSTLHNIKPHVVTFSTPSEERNGSPPPDNHLGPLVQAFQRLVILGPPGAGKSTLLRHLTAINAMAWLARANLPPNASPEALPEPEVLASLPIEQQMAWNHWLGIREQLWNELGWSAPRFPLLVNMRLLRDVLKWPDTRKLHEAIELDVEKMGFTGCPRGFFAQRLHDGHTVLMLDAFDELGSPDARKRIGDLTGTLLADFLNEQDVDQRENRIIASARPIGYEDQLAGSQFVTWEVDALDSGQQAALVRRYYSAFARAEQRRVYLDVDLPPAALAHNTAWADNLLQQLGIFEAATGEPLLHTKSVNKGLRPLARNPLLLSLIVARHYSGYELPAQRHELYEVCVDGLVENWRRFKEREENLPGLGSIAEPDPLSRLDKLELLGGLALLVQDRRISGSDRAVVLPEKEALAYLVRRLGGDFAERYTQALNVLPPIKPPRKRREFWEEQARFWLAGIEAQAGACGRL
jgi:energy-coupling factor transporter ATP-binding protein EcfA2